MKVLISGGSGMVGSQLSPVLKSAGHELFYLVRRPSRRADEFAWDTVTGEVELQKLEAAGEIHAFIHLAGENIANSRWSAAQKARIYNSRVGSTEKLCRALSSLSRPPSIYVGASAIGYYGNRGDEVLTEKSSAGTGFLAETCVAWENAASVVFNSNSRMSHLRFGVILSRSGGALKRMVPPFKAGLGGPLGTGRQWVSWIGIRDAVRAIHFVLEDEKAKGAFNVTAPEPVRNAEFSSELAQCLHRPAVFRTPAFVLRAAFGQMGSELLLGSARVIPGRLSSARFEFEEPTLRGALEQELAH